MSFNHFFIEKQNESRTARWVAFIGIVLFVLFFKIQYHEFWRDEWQAWLVARDMSFGEMFSFLYYEGHPCLWYVYLKFWTFFPIDNQVVTLKIAHFIPWAAALYFLFFRLRFSILLSIGLALSYFVFFEYGIVSRGYALVMLFAFWVISLLKSDGVTTSHSLTRIGLLLFLLCQTEAQGVLIAISFATYFYLSEKKWPWEEGSVRKITAWLIAGGILFLFTVFPYGNAEELATARNKGLELSGAFQGLFANTFLPGIVGDTRTSGVDGFGILLAFLVIAALTYLFFEKKKVLYSFGLAALLFFIFAAVLFLGGMRQWGNFYIVFIAFLSIWIAQKPKIDVIRAGILAIFLLVGLSYTVRAAYKDMTMPFSNAKECGLFIKENVPTNVPIVGIDPFKTAGVGAYANRALFKMPEGEEFTYFHWLRKVYVPSQQELLLFVDYKKVKGIVLISPNPLPKKGFKNAQLWKAFDGQDMKGERYWVYMVQR